MGVKAPQTGEFWSLTCAFAYISPTHRMLYHGPSRLKMQLGIRETSMAMIVRSKDEYTEKSAADMNRHLDAAQWSARQKLALACRILAAEEHGSALAGQLTTRGDRPGTYWIMRFGLGLDEISADNLLLVDDDLRLLEGDGMPNPSNRFHLWIYRQRPGGRLDHSY